MFGLFILDMVLVIISDNVVNFLEVFINERIEKLEFRARYEEN